ncbi:TolC family protein [Martelella soudanensis]|uniref:TolC family protein n=1 Tax=unclassified Martelella TaxID=2629616 RepID=UPI0015DD9390|nr:MULTISPECIES: TolC family protein [unclassified Martelella]
MLTLFAGLPLTLAGCSTSGNGRPSVSFEDRTGSIQEERPEIEKPAGFAEAGESLDGLVTVALYQSPEMMEQAAIIREATGNIDVAKGDYMPMVSGGVTGGLGDADGPSFVLSANQLLFDFGRTDRKVARADIVAQEAVLSFQSNADMVLMEVLDAYAEFDRYRNNVRIDQERVSRLSELADLINQRAAAGATTQPDVLAAANSVEKAKHALLEMKSERDRAANQLREYSGPAAVGLKAELQDFVEACTPTTMVSEVLPEIAVARLQVAQAELDYEDARKARLPGVSAEAYGRQPLYEEGFRVGVNFNVLPTLFQGGAIEAARKAAEEAVAAAKANLDKVRRTATLASLDAGTEMTNARALIASAETQTRLLDETRTLYRSQYFDMGTRSLTDLLNAEEDYYDALIAGSDSERDLDVALLKCHLANGTLRAALGLSQMTLYGYPIDSFGIDVGEETAALEEAEEPPEP